jgi:hypothetical protein
MPSAGAAVSAVATCQKDAAVGTAECDDAVAFRTGCALRNPAALNHSTYYYVLISLDKISLPFALHQSAAARIR